MANGDITKKPDSSLFKAFLWIAGMAAEFGLQWLLDFVLAALFAFFLYWIFTPLVDWFKNFFL